MLIENLAPYKLVEVHWAGEDRVWHILRAEYLSSNRANREIGAPGQHLIYRTMLRCQAMSNSCCATAFGERNTYAPRAVTGHVTL